MTRSVSKPNSVAAIAPMPVMNQPSSPALSLYPTGTANSAESQTEKAQLGVLPLEKSNGKGIPTERDSVNALLSLGRDLQAEEAEAAAAASSTDQTGESLAAAGQPLAQLGYKPPAKRPPLPILPEVLASKPAKKRHRKINTSGDAHNPATRAEYPGGAPTLLDFWFWLPDGESIGEWDVLCGRGGESNNFIGNRRFRSMVHSRKAAYREIPVQQRKAKTAFVKSIVNQVNSCGGRFLDLDDVSGKCFVVTMEKARKKASQALRETKELKWLEFSESQEPEEVIPSNTLCPFCNKPGHKTKIAKSCLKHHEWMASTITSADTTSPPFGDSNALKGEDVRLIAKAINVNAGDCGIKTKMVWKS